MQRSFLLILAATVPLAGFIGSARAADPPLDSPEQKVLDRWIGAWRVDYKKLKSEWTPEEQQLTGELSVERIVGGRFVQETSTHSEGSAATKILAYDDAKRTYRGWWFSSTGLTSETTGRWDASAATMTWTSVLREPFTTTIVERFVADDKLEWSVVAADREKELFRMEGTTTRIKPPAN
jgi:hypothetical protein